MPIVIELSLLLLLAYAAGLAIGWGVWGRNRNTHHPSDPG